MPAEEPSTHDFSSFIDAFKEILVTKTFSGVKVKWYGKAHITSESKSDSDGLDLEGDDILEIPLTNVFCFYFPFLCIYEGNMIRICLMKCNKAFKISIK